MWKVGSGKSLHLLKILNSLPSFRAWVSLERKKFYIEIICHHNDINQDHTSSYHALQPAYKTHCKQTQWHKGILTKYLLFVSLSRIGTMLSKPRCTFFSRKGLFFSQDYLESGSTTSNKTHLMRQILKLAQYGVNIWKPFGDGGHLGKAYRRLH